SHAHAKSAPHLRQPKAETSWLHGARALGQKQHQRARPGQPHRPPLRRPPPPFLYPPKLANHLLAPRQIAKRLNLLPQDQPFDRWVSSATTRLEPLPSDEGSHDGSVEIVKTSAAITLRATSVSAGIASSRSTRLFWNTESNSDPSRHVAVGSPTSD